MRKLQASRNVPHDTTRDKGMNPSRRIVTVAARTIARAGKPWDLALPNDMAGTSIGDCIVEKSGEIRLNFKRREHTEEVANHNCSKTSCPCESGEEEVCGECVIAGGLQLTHPSCCLRGVPLRRLQLFYVCFADVFLKRCRPRWLERWI